MASFGNEMQLAGLLCKILKDHPIVSVSFLNSQFKGKGTNHCITFDFLKRFPEFGIAIIGSDLKIFTNESIESKKFEFNENDSLFLGLSQILVKDFQTVSSLKKKLIENAGEATLSILQEEWSSNKYKYNLPFIVRNSHNFTLYKRNGNSYVKECLKPEFELDKEGIWQIVDVNVKDLVKFSLKKLLQSIDYPVNQGTLQVCIDYGFAAIDKGFMMKYDETFVGGGDRGITLKGCKVEDQIVRGGNKRVIKSPSYNERGSSSLSSPDSSLSNLVSPVSSVSTPLSGELGSHLVKIKEAYQKQQTVILLGENDKERPLFLTDSCYSNAQHLEFLTNLKLQIDSEIRCKTFSK